MENTDEMEDEKPRRFWFYRPELYWFGWRTLLPISRGHDEFHRWTLVLGWTITGRIIIAGRVHECPEDVAPWV